MLFQTDFGGNSLEVDLSPNLHPAADEIELLSETFIDLNDEIYGLDHNKAQYFKDGHRSLVFSADLLKNVTSGKNFDKLELGDTTAVTRDKGVRKLVLRPGSGIAPAEDAQLWVHSIWFAEGSTEPFDSTITRRRMDTFRLNGRLLPCLQIAVRTMHFKEVSLFISEPQYAYGRLGCPPRVPAGSRVLFIVELMEFSVSQREPMFLESAGERQKLDFEDVIAEAQRLRQVGNSKFAAGNYTGAEKCYSISMKILEEYSAGTSAQRALQAYHAYKALSNLAECHLRMDDYLAVCDIMDRVIALRLPMMNAKLLYRYAKALITLEKPTQAMTALKEALSIEPSHIDILALVEEVKSKESSREQGQPLRCSEKA